ncbi:hypothetical protein IFM89_032796 [Coptis chinensis]|uniref:Uncharacterized protein n=1 Tax=Coptis chinensis TaxID=261450 RepID=A0A835HQV1_9MAGN|nr:hypothetical protein IFM89_032796 [Coptis chinensis]
MAKFFIDSNFGIPSAIAVTNKHQKEFFLESIVIEGLACGPVHFSCNSWVQSKKYHLRKRVFFSNKVNIFFLKYYNNVGKRDLQNYGFSHICLHETPIGAKKKLKEKELSDLRGDGQGERKHSDRIYDYAIYNDLGNLDKGIDLARPKLGGEAIPFPRRCRTGHSPTNTGWFPDYYTYCNNVQTSRHGNISYL